MAKQTAVPEGVNFGDLGMYQGDFGIPAGKWALEFKVAMFKGEKSTLGERLCVLIRAHSIDDESHRGENAIESAYSMGGKAHLSFAPNPQTGKGIVVVPGGPSSSLPPSTNWGVFLKSLYDSGLPNGVFTNDFTTLDGIHVAIARIPEPAERAGFGAPMEGDGQKQTPRQISVVSEILDDGKPWENSGGIPGEGKAKPPAKGKAAPTPIKKEEPEETAEVDAEVLETATTAGGAILGKDENVAGMSWPAFRTQVFSRIEKKEGKEVAQSVADAFFGSDDGAATLLDALGYKKAGLKVVPA